MSTNSEFICSFPSTVYRARFKYIPDDEAVIALKEQAQRYNTCRRQKKARLSCGESESRRMSRESETTNQHNEKLDVTVPIPDYLKVKIDREEDIRKKGGFLNAISNKALYQKNDLTIGSKDIVQVQPATHVDPFSKEGGELGTSSLRQSSTEYDNRTTFSIILPSLQGTLLRDYSDIDLSEKWCVPKFLPGIICPLGSLCTNPPFLVMFVPGDRNLKGAKENENPCSVHWT